MVNVSFQTSKQFLVDTVLGSSMLKGGSKYEFKHVLSLKKRTGFQYRKDGSAGIFKPVETLGGFAFLIQVLFYAAPLFVVGNLVSSGVINMQSAQSLATMTS